MLDSIRASDIAGFSALIVTVGYTCLGLPSQIRKNRASRSTSGLSLLTMVLMSLTFLTWLAYGLLKPGVDWYLVLSNFPGSVFALTILYQFRRYGKHRPPSRHIR